MKLRSKKKRQTQKNLLLNQKKKQRRVEPSRGPPNTLCSGTGVFSIATAYSEFVDSTCSEAYAKNLEDWSFRVKKIFSFKCVLLNKKGSKLESHHIFAKGTFPELSLLLLNGLPLREDIHQLFPQTYGYRTTIDDLLDFLDLLQYLTIAEDLDKVYLQKLKNYFQTIKPGLEALIVSGLNLGIVFSVRLRLTEPEFRES